MSELHAMLKEIQLGLMDTLDMEINGKRYTLLDLKNRMDKQEKAIQKAKSAKKLAFVCDANGNPVMHNGERDIDTVRSTPERIARVEALRQAYEDRESEELSAFGEYREKKDFFGNTIEEICDVEPAVEIGNVDANSLLEKFAEKINNV
jgi:hypothetical protein